MQSSISALLPLLDSERAAHHAAVLAVVTQTAGSTYSKPGGLMLIAADGRFAGLLSGGCLEGDLREHARAVLDDATPRTVSYDMRTSDDLVFGLGAGCEGAMDIFLLPIGPATDWRPLAFFAECAGRSQPAGAAFVVQSRDPSWPAGAVAQSNDARASPLAEAARATADSRRAGWFESPAVGLRAFCAALWLPPRVVLLGGGPDAAPVVQLASFLGWKTTVVDHRPAYARLERFPGAEAAVLAHADDASLALEQFDAAVVMSHHLPSDLAWLQRLATSRVPYIGLLGPAARRERLLSDLGANAIALRGRLRAPVGLDLGGRSPQSIALSIVAEIHAAMEGREGRPFSARLVVNTT